MPTREALRRLAADGFAAPVHGRGYQIAPITIERVREAFDAIRLVLPGLAVMVSQRASREEKRAFTALVNRHLGGEFSADTDANPLRYFLELCRNPTVAEMVGTVAEHVSRMIIFAVFKGTLLQPGFRSAVDEALAAIETAEEDEIREQMEAVSDAVRDAIIAALQQSRSVLTAPIAMED
jgi:DNA-binding GntR family transcriptional regulator